MGLKKTMKRKYVVLMANLSDLAVEIQGDTYSIHSLTIEWYHSMSSISNDENFVIFVIWITLRKKLKRCQLSLPKLHSSSKPHTDGKKIQRLLFPN